MLEFLQKIIQFLNGNNIPYMLSGSVALTVYALPRATRDFDFIVHLKTKDINALSSYFSNGYYVSVDAVEHAVKNKGMFNIIDHASGFKADFIILKDEPFRQAEFQRRRKVDFLGEAVYVVSSEDLLISKLIWIQEIQSSLQISDIKILIELKDLNWSYVNNWIKLLNLNTFGLL